MLRAKLIRLAYTKPELRPHLLPLLKVAERTKGEVWQTPAGNWRAKNQAGNEKSYPTREQAQGFAKGKEQGDKLPKSKSPMGKEKVRISPEQAQTVRAYARDSVRDIEDSVKKLDDALDSDAAKKRRESNPDAPLGAGVDKILKGIHDDVQKFGRALKSKLGKAGQDKSAELYDITRELGFFTYTDKYDAERAVTLHEGGIEAVAKTKGTSREGYPKVWDDLVDEDGKPTDNARWLTYADIPDIKKAIAKVQKRISDFSEESYESE